MLYLSVTAPTPRAARTTRLVTAMAGIALVACGDSPGPEPRPDSAAVAAAVDVMLEQLMAHIGVARAYNEDLIPRNPQNTAFLEAKIAMLDGPTLASDIVSDRRYSGRVIGSGGQSVPVVTVFPLDTMRAGAEAGVAAVAPAVPLLEEFFHEPLFTQFSDAIRIWYGFVLGNSASDGALEMEDRGTYETRTPSTRVPWDAILDHELAHGYVSHESLTQFLELYVYNRIVTGSEAVADWTYTRGYTPFASGNTDVHALLDVYQLIGREAMATAYRDIRLIGPPYGMPLDEASKQAFVDAAPAAVRTQVAALVDRVTY